VFIALQLSGPQHQAYFPIYQGTYGEDTLIASSQEYPFQKPSALVMQEKFIPLVFHEFTN
jgi:hypothetical protein